MSIYSEMNTAMESKEYMYDVIGKMMPNESFLEKLRDRIDKDCLEIKQHTLSSGRTSNFYFDIKRVMLAKYTLDLIAHAFLNVAIDLPHYPRAVGGMSMGADFIVASVLQKSSEIGGGLGYGSIVRKEVKEHGTQNKIENRLTRLTPIMVVDDVVTTGASIDAACTEFLLADYNIVGIVALVDREEGGMEMLREKYYCPIKSIFGKRDFPRIAAL